MVVSAWALVGLVLSVAGLGAALALLSLSCYRARSVQGGLAAWAAQVQHRRYAVALGCAAALTCVGVALSAALG